MKIEIKPLSVNDAWKGKRYKTDKYKKFQHDLLLLLPRECEIPEGELHIDIVFGFSNGGSDWDNPIKPFVDILQKKYGFNDNRIKSATVLVSKKKKGEESIGFLISPHDTPCVNVNMQNRIKRGIEYIRKLRTKKPEIDDGSKWWHRKNSRKLNPKGD